jgi:hypothetical protein
VVMRCVQNDDREPKRLDPARTPAPPALVPPSHGSGASLMTRAKGGTPTRRFRSPLFLRVNRDDVLRSEGRRSYQVLAFSRQHEVSGIRTSPRAP